MGMHKTVATFGSTRVRQKKKPPFSIAANVIPKRNAFTPPSAMGRANETECCHVRLNIVKLVV